MKVVSDTSASCTVIGSGRVPIKSWARDLDEQALVQAMNLAHLPFAISHVALMADAHAGYGMPIGGVLFADAAVVPTRSESTSGAACRWSRPTSRSRTLAAPTRSTGR